jgi:cytochrome b561
VRPHPRRRRSRRKSQCCRAFDLGLFRVDFGVRSNRVIFHPTEEVHGYLAYTLFALVSMHLLTALWHQFV